jgi:hypothetical protein
MQSKQYHIRAVYLPGRLQEKLKWIEDFPMTFLEAPPGYGKTTALKCFFEQERFASVPVHWLTILGESEQASWLAFADIIGRVDPACGEELQRLGSLSMDNLLQVESILRRIICPEETYIVLDNKSSIFGIIELSETIYQMERTYAMKSIPQAYQNDKKVSSSIKYFFKKYRVSSALKCAKRL